MERQRDKLTIGVSFSQFIENLRAMFKRMRPLKPLFEGAGWGVYSEDGSVRLRRSPNDVTFADDEAVWLHVYRLQKAGSSDADAALAILSEHAPREYRRVMDYGRRNSVRGASTRVDRNG